MKKLFTGNEAVARGVWEAGVKFASAYPGTPSTEILENISKYDEIVSEWSPNEKVALEASAGASIAGIRSVCSMKHVGVNVAADPMFTFAYLGVNGGSVVITADEPGMHSSQNEQDNRHYARHAKMPMFEPSDSQEAKDMIKDAFDISEKYDCPVLYRLTTRICHSKSIVECTDRLDVPDKEYVKNIQKYCPLPAFSRILREKLEDKFTKMREYSNHSKWNYIEDNHKKIGVIASGAAFRYAKEVFGEDASYLKIGFSYPLPDDLIKEFSELVETIYIIEEDDPIMETEIKALGVPCIGKEVLPKTGELLPERIREAIFGEKAKGVDVSKDNVVARPPSLCAGCPHRGLFYELGKLKDVMIFSDIGCYSLGLSAPYNATDAMICMGASISGGHGVAKAMKIKNASTKVLSVIGDSTFFHSGMTGLLDVAYNNSDTLTVILDNRITGMTGHQENPGTGYNIKGEPATQADIETIVKALGIKNVKTIDPNNLKETKEALQWGLDCEEASVVITRWPCALKQFSKEDKEEFTDAFKKTAYVDQDACIGCKKCLSSGCPAFTFDTEKKKASIIESDCVGCGVCVQICPVGAIKFREEV